MKEKLVIFRGYFRNVRGVSVQSLGSYALAMATAIIIVAILAQSLGQIKTTQESCSSGVTDEYSKDPITFTLNYTYYPPSNTPICTLTLYYFPNTTYPLPSS